MDDEEDLRDALAEQLLITGEFLIEQAGSARETLDQVSQQDFDIIILDIGLPDTDLSLIHI